MNCYYSPGGYATGLGRTPVVLHTCCTHAQGDVTAAGRAHWSIQLSRPRDSIRTRSVFDRGFTFSVLSGTSLR